MNGLVIAFFGYVLLGLELALRPALTLGMTGIGPHLVIVLAVFVAMCGQGIGIYWCAALLGLAVDLTTKHSTAQGLSTFVSMGPMALGFVLAAVTVVTLRGVMMRRSPLALPFLSLVACALAHIVAIFLLTIHSWMDPAMVWDLSRELGARMGSAVYTAVIAIGLSPILRWAQGLMGLEESSARRFGRAGSGR